MCTPPVPTFDDGSSWTVDHNTATCNNRAVIHVSAGCGSSGYNISLFRTLEGESEEQIYTNVISNGPIFGEEHAFDEVPNCGRGNVTYQWKIVCGAAVEATSDPVVVEQGGPGEIISTALAMDENCRITAACRISNPNCGECAGTLKLYRRTGLEPAFDPGEIVFTAPTINSPYANDDFTYSETLEDGTYFYAWQLFNADGGIDATSVSASVNPECNVYVPEPVALLGEFQKQIMLVKVTGSPQNWTYTDIKLLNEAEQRLEWFYHKNGGCGSFRFLTHEFLDTYFDDALAQAWEIHVRIKLVGEYYYTTWFRGVIRSIRQQEQGAEMFTDMRGYGYVEMLDNVQVQKQYNAGLTVKDVVDDILATFIVPYTRIVRPYDLDPTNGDFGTDASPYILQKPLHFECSALKAIKFLAELQGNREFGVDAARTFYFRESITTVRKNFFVGHDLIDRVAGGKTFGATNKVKVAGKSHGPRDLLKVREDVTETAQHGVYETVHEVPWVTGDYDASRWADNIISKYKNTQDWSVFQWQNINYRVDSQHPIGRIQVFGNDVSNDRQSFDVAKIQYIEGGYKSKQEIREIGRAAIQSSIDQPPLRAIFYVGQYPRDIVEELEIQLREQLEALKGRHKQFRYPNDVTNSTEPGKIPGEIKHFSKDITNHDITNNPAELQDITNPRGLVMAWIDNQWVKVSNRRTVHTLPARGKFIGEILSLITDSTLSGYGELRWWNGSGWQVLSSSTGAITGAGTNPQVAFWNGVNTLTGDAGLTYNVSQDRLILTGGSGPRITAEVTGAAAAIELSNLTTGDAALSFAGGGIVFMQGLDQSASRYAISKASSLGTSSDLLRLTTSGEWSYVGQAVSTGAADEFTHHDFNIGGGTITFTTDVTLATQRAVRFRRPTYAADAATQTITNAATVYIENAPAAGTNVAITNPYALWVDDGAVRFDGWLNVGTATDAAAAGDFSAGDTTSRMFWDKANERLTLFGIEPEFMLHDTDSAADAKRWRTLANVGILIHDLVNDSFTVSNEYMRVTRSGATPTSVIFNESGLDIDFRIEGDTDPNLLFCDASTDRVGIGTSNVVGCKFAVIGGGVQLDVTTAYTTFYALQDFVAGRGIGLGYDTSGQIGVIQATGGASGQIAFWNYQGAWVETMRIDETGKLGIGVTDPVQKLHVVGHAGVTLGNALLTNIATTNNGEYAIHTSSVSPFPMRIAVSADAITKRPFEIGYYDTSTLSGVWTSTFYVGVVDGRVGVGTSGPDAKLDVLSTSTQLRLTYTDGSVYTDFTVTSLGRLQITPTGVLVSVIAAQAGTNMVFDTENTSAAADSGSLIRSITAGSGDAAYVANISGGQSWIWGLDNSDADRFKISASAALGTSDCVIISTSGLFTIPAGNLVVSRSENGAAVSGIVQNTSNTAGSHAKWLLEVAGSSAGDAYIQYDITGGGGATWSHGPDTSDSNTFKLCASGTIGTSSYLTITTAGLVTTGVGGWIGNEAGADVDLRWESDDESYCLMVEGTLNNVVMCANAEPGFQSMDGGVFLAEANVVPTGNPTAGIYIYVEGGAGKARGTGGTITTWAPAEPHCEVCGTDYGHEWENTRWGRLQFCVNCLADDVAKRNGGELPKWIKREAVA